MLLVFEYFIKLLIILNSSHAVISSSFHQSSDSTEPNLNDVFLTSDNTKNPLIALMPTPIDSGSDQSETDDSSMNTSNEHFNIEEEEEEDGGDSDVSEERNQEDFAEEKLSQARLPGAIDSQQPSDAVSLIFNSFNNRKTFSCPKIKTDFVTGTDIADLSPEDVGMIAAMGDSLATGTGLWPHTDIEFRGAAFPIGGDATIDGLVTIPNILHEFNDKLAGVSHGMGTRNQLPPHQLNVAEGGATSSSMPEQARELVRRIKGLREVDATKEWAMIIITIGTEEICTQCEPPDYESLLEAISILNKGIRKAFVVLLGPIHVSSSYRQQANLLKSRCGCSKERSDEFMKRLSKQWADAFKQLQSLFDSPPFKGCPYFRNLQNRHYCRLLRHIDVVESGEDVLLQTGPLRRRSQKNLYVTAITVVFIAFCTVCSIGTLFYHLSKQTTTSRYEPEPDKIVTQRVSLSVCKEDHHAMLHKTN